MTLGMPKPKPIRVPRPGVIEALYFQPVEGGQWFVIADGVAYALMADGTVNKLPSPTS